MKDDNVYMSLSRAHDLHIITQLGASRRLHRRVCPGSSPLRPPPLSRERILDLLDEAIALVEDIDLDIPSVGSASVAPRGPPNHRNQPHRHRQHSQTPPSEGPPDQ